MSAASGGNSEPKQGSGRRVRGLLPPKHDAGTATRHYRAFWQRRCRAAAAGAALRICGIALIIKCSVGNGQDRSLQNTLLWGQYHIILSADTASANAADAKPKAQIILDAAKVSAASGGNSEPKQGQRSQSARGFCPRSMMRVPQPDIIEHFGNADAVPQPPERHLELCGIALIIKCSVGNGQDRSLQS